MAQFFNYYPKTFYSSNTNSTGIDTVTNIITRFSFEDTLKQNSAAFYKYSIKDSDTPEIIADKFYGDSERHWIVLLFNDIIDPQFEWPLQYSTFIEYVNNKYTNPLGTHHYEVTQSSGKTSSSDYSHLIEVSSSTSGATVVTNYEYERRLQDEKREIKLLDKKYLAAFVREFDKLVKL